MNRRFAFVLIFLAPLLAASTPAVENARPAVQKDVLSGRSIAVIPGTVTDINREAAEFISRSLAKKSLITVVPQQRIASLLPKYPTPIQGPYTLNYVAGFKEDYTRTHTAKIRSIQRELHVDYLYVVWAPTSDRGIGGTVTHYFIAQLFQAPGSMDIDHGTFASSTSGRTSLVFFRNCLAIVSLKYNPPTREQELNELEQDSDDFADHVLAVLDERQ